MRCGNAGWKPQGQAVMLFDTRRREATFICDECRREVAVPVDCYEHEPIVQLEDYRPDLWLEILPTDLSEPYLLCDRCAAKGEWDGMPVELAELPEIG